MNIAGTWTIRVLNEDSDDVSKSPFHLECYDVKDSEIIRDDEGPISVREPYEFHGNILKNIFMTIPNLYLSELSWQKK